MDKNQKSSNGVSFVGLITIVFIVLKLCNVIDWSWWFVLAPLWGPIAILAVVWLFVLLCLFKK